MRPQDGSRAPENGARACLKPRGPWCWRPCRQDCRNGKFVAGCASGSMENWPSRSTVVERRDYLAALLDDLQPRAALVAIARDFHARGWMAGTAGNLSAREDENHFWITASGKPKGRLDENDFLLVCIQDGAVIERRRPEDKPSAETTIHAALYLLFPRRARLFARPYRRGVPRRRPREAGREETCGCRRLRCLRASTSGSKIPKWTCRCSRTRSMSPTSREIEKRFRKTKPPLTALMVRTHGPTVWGKSLQGSLQPLRNPRFSAALRCKALKNFSHRGHRGHRDKAVILGVLTLCSLWAHFLSFSLLPFSGKV